MLYLHCKPANAEAKADGAFKRRIGMTTNTLASPTNAREVEPLMVRPEYAAQLLDVCPRTIQRMCASGQLKAVRVRSSWRINRNELMKFAGIE